MISTIDIFKNPKYVDENSPVDTEGLQPYGYNRYQLEKWVRDHYSEALIIRLPSLFGKGIKKNFIYDYINVIPFMLNENKYKDLQLSDCSLADYYENQNNGFYKIKQLSALQKENLKNKFRTIGFSALNFTDSRSHYQFYDLAQLWKDIQNALEVSLRLWHPATEPVTAGEVYKYLTGKDFVNELPCVPVDYDYRTVYASVFGGTGGYIKSKEEVLKQIKDFVENVL